VPAIEETLRSLRDVQGVYGSFVVAGSGALVARDLPAVFDSDVFAEVGPRLVRLFETFLADGEDLDSAMLRYAEHKLYVRKMTWGVIGVLSTVAVNLPALRMVANLVVRKSTRR
jgi:predicted regulator of Ras-like GTPase activity (Roadblock/LC7/MglB family)